MRLRKDSNLRSALYGLYRALFEAKKSCPDDFNDSRLNTIQTAYMALENVGWRVVGITPEALKLLASVDFRKEALPRKLCRGHIVDRIQTTRKLFNRKQPVSERGFFQIFLASDRTVIMLAEQNQHGSAFPNFIEVDNPDGTLFPNGGLMAWKHQKKERDFLMALAKHHKIKKR
jgi:hypothetical protein